MRRTVTTSRSKSDTRVSDSEPGTHRAFLLSSLSNHLNMPHIEPRLVPDEYYSAKDIDRLFTALENHIKQREVMHRKEAADFLGINIRTLDRLATEGNLPYHRLKGLEGTRLYLRRELLDFISQQ